MELDKAIQNALDGNAVLLTGSGFSYGAKSIRKNPKTSEFEDIPLGNGLKQILLKELGGGYTDETLEDISNFFIKKKGKPELIRILIECFTASHVEDYHKKIMSINWNRIYTTNYDKVAEISAPSDKEGYKIISLDDSFDDKDKNRICVHINGVIDELNEETLNKRFKLINRSYNAESLMDNRWFDFMVRNFQNAKAIIIVGFSMSFDLDIKRVISSIAEKDTIVFITKSDIGEIERDRLESYGTVYPIGVDGLAEKIDQVDRVYVKKASKEYNFTSFLHYSHRDVAIKDNTELTDILKFYSQGIITDSIFKKNTLGYGKYVVLRKQLLTILSRWKRVKAFVVTSYLGNGKTVFCRELIEELREKNIDVFYFIGESVDTSSDVEKICNIKKQCVVIIDDFYKHYSTLKDFDAYGCKYITFILTGRISKEESNIRKIKKQLNLSLEDICSISLNQLSKDECDNLAQSMQNERFVPKGLCGEDIGSISSYLQNECKGRIADIALQLYESSPIKHSLETLYQSAISDYSGLKELTIASICNSVMSLGLSKFDISSIFMIDFIVARSNSPEIFDELFGYGDDISEFKSSIVSREILYHIIENQDVIEVLTKIAEYANVKRMSESRFDEILKALVSHYNFSSGKYSFNASCVKEFYEGIRNLDFYSKNPFFWEQFALVCIDIFDFQTAHQCVDNAYSEARKIHGFVPFQICTIDADLEIHEEIYKLSCEATLNYERVVEISNVIRDAKNKLLRYYDHPENNKGYVFFIAEQIPKLFDLIKAQYTIREHNIYIQDMVDLMNKIEIYSASIEGKKNFEIHKIKQSVADSIQEAKSFLKS